MEKLRGALKWRWIRALRVWNRLPIRAQGGITVFIPVVAVLISFCFAIYGNLNRATLQLDIERKFKAVRQYSDLLTLMIDAETGERGFILTGRSEFLEPYKKATAGIGDTINQLKETIEAEPGTKPRLDRIEGLSKIERLINIQLAHLHQSQSFSIETIDRGELYNHLQAGKATMDEIRSNISAMQNREESLLGDRIEEINYIRNRDYVVIFITLIIGLLVRIVAFYLFDRGIVRRINRLADYIAARMAGEDVQFPASKKSDAVGALEQKVIALSEKIETGIRGH
jgi:CHASE3 domain sensor protein